MAPPDAKIVGFALIAAGILAFLFDVRIVDGHPEFSTPLKRRRARTLWLVSVGVLFLGVVGWYLLPRVSVSEPGEADLFPTPADPQYGIYGTRYFLSGYLLRFTVVCGPQDYKKIVDTALGLVATPELKRIQNAYPDTTQTWAENGAKDFNAILMQNGMDAACASAVKARDRAEAILKQDGASTVHTDALTIASLMTAEVPDLAGGSDDPRKVTLKRGLYRKNFEQIVLDTNQNLYVNGDFDNDGNQDIATLIEANGGGSGDFIYLAVFLNKKGTPKFASAGMLGDRVITKKVQYTNGIFEVEMVAQAGNDPMCCPTHPVTAKFKLVNGSLVKVGDWASHIFQP